MAIIHFNTLKKSEIAQLYFLCIRLSNMPDWNLTYHDRKINFPWGWPKNHHRVGNLIFQSV